MKAPLLIAALGAATGTLLLAGTLTALAAVAPGPNAPGAQAYTRAAVASVASSANVLESQSVGG